MKTGIPKAILIGLLAGALIYFMPFFLFGGLFIFLIVGFFFRFFGRRSGWRNDYHRDNFWNPSYTHRWQSMSEEERNKFMQKMEKELFADKLQNQD